MRCRWRGVMYRLLTVMIIGLAVSAAGAETGIVEGTVSLQTKEGETIPGDWIRVLLVRDLIPIPPLTVANLDEDRNPKVREDILNAHMAFFKAVRNQQADADYLADATLSTNTGTFKFVGVPPGHYYVVVTFPSLIVDYKVAWQVPVTVIPGENVHIRLDQRNMALPSYSRE